MNEILNLKIEKTMNYYDGIANGYGELYHQEQIKKIKYISHYLPKIGLVLDLGSGDGVFNQFVSKDVKVISIDLSFKLLKLNSNNFKLNASILNLPLKSNYFDFVVSFTVFQDLPNIKMGIDQVLRILKNNGIFIISFLHMSLKAEIILDYLKSKFEIIENIKESKDYILVLRKK